MNKENNIALDTIINLIYCCKKDPTERFIKNPFYLLGQAVRQYKIDSNKYFVSKQALALWEQLTTENIFDYEYRTSIKCNKPCNIDIDTFVGASTKGIPIHLTEKSQFVFRAIFHDEHIVPIKSIVTELLALNKPTRDTVQKILNKIYVCKMLKTEDHNIKNKYNRNGDVIEIVETVYKESNIEIVNWENIKENILKGRH